jgi:hypothetical protein
MDPLKHAAAFVAGALASQYGVRGDRPAHALSAAVNAAPPASSRGAAAAPPPSSSSSSSSTKGTTTTIPPLLRDYAQTAAAVAAAGALAAAAAATLSLAGSALASRLIFEAEVDSRDDAYRWLMLWLSLSNSGGSGGAAASRASRVSVTTSMRAFGTSTDVPVTIEGGDNGDGSSDDEDEKTPTTKTAPFALLPAPGTHLIWHNNSRPFIVSRRRSPGHSPSNARLLPETLTLRTPRRGGRAATLALLRDARRAYRRHARGATAVHGVDASGMYWELAGTRPRRPLSSVVLPLEQDNGRLLADCRRFLSSGGWYASRGIPHRRGYLLHGPPGTGKSSLVAALAAELGLDIHAVTLSSPALTDDGLRALLNAAGARACLLLEDVDAAACAASRGDGGGGGGAGATANGGGGNSSSLTLSGLLNAIDGVAAQEGRLLFLTTNHPERLDPALVRPGRVDVRVTFARASRSQLRRLFLRFFFDDGAGGEGGNENEAALLATRFAAALPEGELSMAAVQGFLLLHRDDPKGAVEAAERGEVVAQGGK